MTASVILAGLKRDHRAAARPDDQPRTGGRGVGGSAAQQPREPVPLGTAKRLGAGAGAPGRGRGGAKLLDQPAQPAQSALREPRRPARCRAAAHHLAVQRPARRGPVRSASWSVSGARGGASTVAMTHSVAAALREAQYRYGWMCGALGGGAACSGA